MTNLFSYELKTDKKQDFVFLDDYIKDALSKSTVKDGIMLIYCPHTTAGITINENADPDVRRDLNWGLNNYFPNEPDYVHFEGNSDGHMKSSLVGASESLIIADGKPILGRWQRIYFAEFDGPRNRTLHIKIIEG